MLHEKEFIAIGFIRKALGFKGQITVEIEDPFQPDFEKQTFVFLEIDGYKIPFKIEDSGYHKGTWVKLKSIDTPEALSKIKNKGLYLLKEDLQFAKKQIVKSELLGGLAGMKIYDETSGLTGIIDRIEQYPQQLMAVIIIEDNEFLVPLVDAFIKEIDEMNDIILLSLPEGLL